ncbi:hypothetical protein ARALYDRAFT_333002 [Arabidopsis lyrata subsp. lyrata]|uniref:Uncharacterized protein n=1 Tax=Arabidopsis lyrata subsp. lyrata TaxID=81972 RepID=D7MVB4_ARALL|nr:hypothetical protein ARALYDRAFT_333002 [Arabidopsis lyrata subsp. lyrata]
MATTPGRTMTTTAGRPDGKTGRTEWLYVAGECAKLPRCNKYCVTNGFHLGGFCFIKHMISFLFGVGRDNKVLFRNEGAQTISDAAGNLKDKAKNTAEEAWDKVKDTTEKIKDTVTGKTEETKESIKATAKTVERSMNTKNLK